MIALEAFAAMDAPRRDQLSTRLERLDLQIEPGEQVLRGLFCVHGANALDTHATRTIRRTLVEAGGLSVLAEKLVPPGTKDGSHGMLLGHDGNSPCMLFLVSSSSSPLDITFQALIGSDEEAGQAVEESSLTAKYGPCFATLTNEADIDKFFPTPLGPSEAGTPGTGSSESVLTPEPEKRVFTYIAEDDEAEEDLLGGYDDGNDDTVGQLPIIPKSPGITSQIPPRAESANGRRLSHGDNTNKTPFRAKAIPSTHGTPSIAPRMTKAAALRLGIDLSKTSADQKASRPSRPESSAGTVQSSDEAASGDSSRVMTPGMVQRPVTPLKSLGRPSLAPRETKASLLRQAGEAGKEDIAAAAAKAKIDRRQSYNTNERSAGFEGLPGFGGRRLTVASTSMAPKIVPRLNKASKMRDTDSSSSASPHKPRQALTTAQRAAQSASRLDELRANRASNMLSPRPGSASASRTSLTPSPLSRSDRSVTDNIDSAYSRKTPLKVPNREPAIPPRSSKAAELRLAKNSAEENKNVWR